MTRRHRRIATLVAVVAPTAVVTAAFAMTTINTGGVYVQGQNTAGVVKFVGTGWARGVISGGRPSVEIHAGSAPVLFASGRKQRRIVSGSDVRIAMPAGTFFSVYSTQAAMQLTMRGPGIDASIVGSGTMTFTGKGAYTPTYGVTRPWPKAAIAIRQPSTSAAHRAALRRTRAHVATVA
jgi:hypothetical protein